MSSAAVFHLVSIGIRFWVRWLGGWSGDINSFKVFFSNLEMGKVVFLILLNRNNSFFRVRFWTAVIKNFSESLNKTI